MKNLIKIKFPNVCLMLITCSKKCAEGLDRLFSAKIFTQNILIKAINSDSFHRKGVDIV